MDTSPLVYTLIGIIKDIILTVASLFIFNDITLKYSLFVGTFIQIIGSSTLI